MLAYEMLTGNLPFPSVKNPLDIINFHMKQEPPSPSKLTEKVAIPSGIDAIILKMVAKSREQRFASATALREESRGSRRRSTARPIASRPTAL